MIPIVPLVLFSGSDIDIFVSGGTTFVTLADGWIKFHVEKHEVISLLCCNLFYNANYFIGRRNDKGYTCRIIGFIRRENKRSTFKSVTQRKRRKNY